MSWRVTFTKQALRQLRKLDDFAAQFILSWIKRNLVERMTLAEKEKPSKVIYRELGAIALVTTGLLLKFRMK